MITQASDTVAEAIRLQNEVLVIFYQKKELAQEVSDRKDLMRKLREK